MGYPEPELLNGTMSVVYTLDAPCISVKISLFFALNPTKYGVFYQIYNLNTFCLKEVVSSAI